MLLFKAYYDIISLEKKHNLRVDYRISLLGVSWKNGWNSIKICMNDIAAEMKLRK